MPKAIIMAGGLGERFWPLTNAKFPKYCIPFGKDRSLLQRTYQRLLLLYRAGDIYVITTRGQKDIIRRELPSLKVSHLILEPYRNNTAPAIRFSCEYLKKIYGGSEVVSFFPADHLIQNDQHFKRTMSQAISAAAKSENLVILGIVPTFPATGFGYLRRGPALRGYPGVFQVQRFIEKPNRAKAKNYLKRGDYYWNSGIFTWKVEVLLRGMEALSPEQGYQKPGLSIDFAVLERAKNVVFCKTSMDWCDLGNWDMWHEKLPKDTLQNHAEGAVKFKDIQRSLVINRDLERPLLLSGVSDIIVVQTRQGTLICRRGHSEEAARWASKK